MSPTTESKAIRSGEGIGSCRMLESGFEIPMQIRTFVDFRQWAFSDEFPEHGRIDFLGNCIEMDMLPEDLFSPGSTKMEIGTVLYLHVQDQDLGFVFSDSTLQDEEAPDDVEV